MSWCFLCYYRKIQVAALTYPAFPAAVKEAAWCGLPNEKGENFMANIGNFNQVGESYIGKLETLTVNIQATLEPVASKRGEKYPLVSAGWPF